MPVPYRRFGCQASTDFSPRRSIFQHFRTPFAVPNLSGVAACESLVGPFSHNQTARLFANTRAKGQLRIVALTN